MNDDGILAALRAEHPLQTSTPLEDASNAPLQPGFELKAGTQDGGTVNANGAVDVGKGVSVGGEVSWSRRMGAAAWGILRWTPRAK